MCFVSREFWLDMLQKKHRNRTIYKRVLKTKRDEVKKKKCKKKTKKQKTTIAAIDFLLSMVSGDFQLTKGQLNEPLSPMAKR